MSKAFIKGTAAVVTAAVVFGFGGYRLGARHGAEAEREDNSRNVVRAFQLATDEIRFESHETYMNHAETAKQTVQDYLNERGMEAKHFGDCLFALEDRSGQPVYMEMENGQKAEAFLCGVGTNGFDLHLLKSEGMSVAEREMAFPDKATKLDVSDETIRKTFGALPDIMDRLKERKARLIIDENRAIDRLQRAEELADPYAKPDAPSKRSAAMRLSQSTDAVP